MLYPALWNHLASNHCCSHFTLGGTLPLCLQGPSFAHPKLLHNNRLVLKICFHEEKLQHITSRKELTIKHRSLLSFKIPLPSLLPFSSGSSCPPNTGSLLSPRSRFPSILKPRLCSCQDFFFTEVCSFIQTFFFLTLLPCFFPSRPHPGSPPGCFSKQESSSLSGICSSSQDTRLKLQLVLFITVWQYKYFNKYNFSFYSLPITFFSWDNHSKLFKFLQFYFVF